MKSRLVISLVALLCSFLSWAAPDPQRVNMQVVFGLSQTTVDPQLNGNAQTVQFMDKILQGEAVPVRVEILSVSSPEGPYAYNKRLSEERAKGMETFLRERYPSLAAVPFSVKTVAEDWEGVEEYLERSSHPWKEDALKIIRQNAADREARLKELWVGEAWDDLKNNCFPRLRRSQIVFVYAPGETPLGFEDCSDGNIRLAFPNGYRNLDPSYAQNAALLSEIRNKVVSGYAGPIVLSGYSSPDGSEKANVRLAGLRAQSVRRYLVNELSYPDSLIVVSPGKVDWDQLTCAVRNEYFGADRDEVLEILTNAETSSVGKKRSLLGLRGGETWSQLKQNFMSELCAVDVHFSDVPAEPSVKEDEPPVTEPPVAEPPVSEPPVTEPVVPADTLRHVVDTSAKVEEIVPTDQPVAGDVSKPEDVSKMKHEKKALFGVGSNLLADAVTAVNVSLEVPVGRRWDITADYYFPWWKNRSSSFAFQILHLDLGARYYFTPGWFASASLGAGYYDFAPWGNGIQGEEVKFSLGGGYTWALGSWWRMSAELGIGPVFTQYRRYEHQTSGELLWLQSGKGLYFAPTSARFSLVYLFHK